MPHFFYHKKIDNSSFLAIDRINDTTQKLLLTAKRVLPEIAYNSCIQAISGIKAEAKMAEKIAVRLLLNNVIVSEGHWLLPGATLPRIEYNGRCPFVECNNKMKLNISISHTIGLVAIFISGDKQTGLDIERVSARTRRIRHKYLSKKENSFIDALPTQWQNFGLTLYWAAKEAMYKLYKNENLIFNEHLLVEQFTPQKSGTFAAAINKNNNKQILVMQYDTIIADTDTELVVCWCSTII